MSELDEMRPWIRMQAAAPKTCDRIRCFRKIEAGETYWLAVGSAQNSNYSSDMYVKLCDECHQDLIRKTQEKADAEAARRTPCLSTDG
jgi:hypothetical protein